MIDTPHDTLTVEEIDVFERGLILLENMPTAVELLRVCAAARAHIADAGKERIGFGYDAGVKCLRCGAREGTPHEKFCPRLPEHLNEKYEAEMDERDRLDATRYRRLQVLGCAPGGTPQLDKGEVLRFSNLDEFVDEDLHWHPSRGEATPHQMGEDDGPGTISYNQRWKIRK